MNDINVRQSIEPHVLDAEASAKLLGIKPASLAKDRKLGHLGIPYIKAGRRVLYNVADLEDWLEANRKTPAKRGDEE